MRFSEEVRRAAEGTPYVVTDTESGFDVTLNIVDAEWYGLFNKAGLKKVYSHHVKLDDGQGTFSITDESRTLEWEAGVPRLAASAEFMRGRVKEFGVETVWAFDEHGHWRSAEALNSVIGGPSAWPGTRAPRRALTRRVGGLATSGPSEDRGSVGYRRRGALRKRLRGRPPQKQGRYSRNVHPNSRRPHTPARRHEGEPGHFHAGPRGPYPCHDPSCTRSR